MARIEESEVLAELAKLSQKSDSGMTSEEWAVKSGMGPGKVTKLLKQAKALGWLVLGKQTREGLDGRGYQATVYRVVRPTKK